MPFIYIYIYIIYIYIYIRKYTLVVICPDKRDYPIHIAWRRREGNLCSRGQDLTTSRHRDESFLVRQSDISAFMSPYIIHDICLAADSKPSVCAHVGTVMRWTVYRTETAAVRGVTDGESSIMRPSEVADFSIHQILRRASVRRSRGDDRLRGCRRYRPTQSYIA